MGILFELIRINNKRFILEKYNEDRCNIFIGSNQ